MQEKGIEVGVVKTIYLYPVKSMRGQEVENARLWWHGLEGDRRYAFVRSENYTGFPWLSARVIPQMIRYVPHFEQPEAVLESEVVVRTPTGQELPVESEALLQELRSAHGAPIHLVKLGRGAFDSMSVSLISTATLAALSEAVGEPLEARRFRPNLLIEVTNEEPFAEETWLGALLQIGDRPDSPRLRMNRKNQRCVVITLNPESAEANPKVLREVVQRREQFAGVYGTAEQPGKIEVGDVLYWRA
ncbi:MAG: MOSC domain-containing protein [Ardenticatenales bacterium]|nr:MOSC domain-containing protein [Ardenticatenales bacterium]